MYIMSFKELTKACDVGWKEYSVMYRARCVNEESPC